MFDLHGKVAVITGASSGLGKQMSYAFANQGASLVLIARNKVKLDEVEKDLKKLGVDVISIKCDVTNTKEISIIIVCLKNSVFIFINLFFIKFLYIFIPLSEIINKTGNKIKFCNINDIKTKAIPLFTPKVAIIAEIVYPIEKPLYIIAT